MEADFNSFAAELRGTPRFIQNSREKPHKLVLLLTILTLIKEGRISENRIYFNQQLRDAFASKFQHYSNATDWTQVSQPYFHLRTASFWHHQIKEGRGEKYATLTTSGGGSKRIDDNIEFAYFSEQVWELFNAPNYQVKIEAILVGMMQDNNLEQVAEPVATKKIGTAFHEQFKLNRAGISQILQFLIQVDGNLKSIDNDSIKAATGLGRNQVISCSNYLRGAGMVDSEDNLTEFGRICYENDPTFARLETQWLIHYNFSIQHGRGPVYWNYLVTSQLGKSGEISKNEIATLIQEFLVGQGQSALAKETYDKAASVFLNSYADKEGLGSLHFLEAQGSGTGLYKAQSPQPLPAAAFACILADYWPILAPQGETTVELGTITRGELAQVLHQSEAQLNALLAELAAPSVGLVQRQRLYTPYTVTRHRLEAATVWDLLYT